MGDRSIQLLGAKEVAVMLGLHPKTVIRLFARREIPAFRPGGKLWRTSREAVNEYVAEKLRGGAAEQMRAPRRPLSR